MSTDRALIALEQQNQSLRARLKKQAGENADAVKLAIHGTAVTLSTFGMAWTEARYPDRAQVGGVPLSLVLGGAGLAAGAADVGGKEYSDLIGMAGIGSLAAYAAKRGTEMGNEARNKAATK